MNEDQQDSANEPSLMKRKLTKRERFKGAVQKGVDKIKKPDEESGNSKDGGFTLNSDVQDFLARRPSTAASSEPQALRPPSPIRKTEETVHIVSKDDNRDFLRNPTKPEEPERVAPKNVFGSFLRRPRKAEETEQITQKDETDDLSQTTKTGGPEQIAPEKANNGFLQPMDTERTEPVMPKNSIGSFLRKQKKTERKEQVITRNDVDDFLNKPAPSDALPRFPSPSPLPKPRVDISVSPRFPDARTLPEQRQNPALVSALRVQSGSRSPRRHKIKPHGLKVRFSQEPPKLIGEGGDEAESPTLAISQAKKAPQIAMSDRSRGNERSMQPEILRKPVAILPTQISPMGVQNSEFELSLATGSGNESPLNARKPSTLPQLTTNSAMREKGASEASPTPTSGSRTKMRAEEGKTLRESFKSPSSGTFFD